MNKILFATHNPSKLNLYRNMLKGLDYELVGLDDLKIDYEVEEIGNDVREIAIKKVKEYSELSNLVTISEDTGLYFEGVTEYEQPGANIRRINNKTLSDEEVIEHYLKLVNKYNGELKGYYLKNVAICDRLGNIHSFEYKVNKVFSNEVNDKRNVGYPLDSISITSEYNKYTVDLTDEENNRLNDKCNKEIFEFIVGILQDRNIKKVTMRG